jgi:tetratricopeptide (TPR) repeat protein
MKTKMPRRDFLKRTPFGTLSALLVRANCFRTGLSAQEVQIAGMGGVSGPVQILADKSLSTTDVSGSFVSDYLFRNFKKPANYAQDLQLIAESRRRALALGFKEFQDAIDELKNQDMRQKKYLEMRAYEALAELWSYEGNMEKAIDNLRSEYEIAVALGHSDRAFDIDEKLGIAQMRRGENENCRDRHNITSCIFPLCPEAQYKRISASEKANRYFVDYLRNKPNDLEVRWLLNLTNMTMGRYPHGVPKQFLIPPSVFNSGEDIGHFIDVAPSLGLNIFDMAGGVIIDDFDNDGLLDVIISSYNASSSLRYFHNNGNGTFTDRAEQAGLLHQLGGLNIIQTDYNNDGWLDILVLRGGWEEPIRKSLLRNNGDGTFTDVTEQAGLASPATRTQTAVWADFDNDGWLDLFVGNEFSASQLFHNNRDGTFTDVAQRAGVDRSAFTKGVVAGDYDNDGYSDIYVSNLGGENFLYHNNGDGTFDNVAGRLYVERPLLSFPAWFFDYNNDGFLDLYVSAFMPSVAETMRSYLGLPVLQDAMPRLYRNTRNGEFEDVTKEVGLGRAVMTMGANFGDVDNDGFLDFYLGTGGPSYAALIPNLLFRNNEGKRFTDITTSSGTGSLQKGHGVAFADINNDGQQEIFCKLGGATLGDRYFSALYMNKGHHKNNWLTIKLVGVKTNRAAIGARIRLTVTAQNGKHQDICRHVSSGGSFGASPLRQHIGIGKASRVERLEIWWPTSNTRQVFHNIRPNQFIEIREFEKDFVEVRCRTFKI